MNPTYSLVVPVFNEAGNVLEVVGAAVGVLARREKAYEIILVDDASTDSTPAEVATAAARWAACRALRLPAHAGQAAALWAGLNEARGDFILTMDGDGQNDPPGFSGPSWS